MVFFKKKSSFILLEAVICLSIVAMVSSYLVSAPAKIFKKQLSSLYSLELAREAQVLFFDLEHNFTKEFCFDQLKKGETLQTSSKILQVNLDHAIKRAFNYQFTLSVLKQKTGATGVSKLVKARLTFYEEGKNSSKEVFDRLFYLIEKKKTA